MTELPNVSEVRVVRVQPGDVIWLRTDARITAQMAEEIKQRAKEFWPDNEIAIGADIDVAIVRPS